MIAPMRPLPALLPLLLLAAAAPPIVNGPVSVCAGPAARNCMPTDLTDIGPGGRETYVERIVTVDPAALPLSRPLMVWLTATASAEIRWNGVLIGRNGLPGPDAAHERPGRFVASVAVPAALVRPGANRVSLRLSAHHLWLPVRRIVHVFEVTSYETPVLPGLGDYLPALLTMGALLAALAYFAAAALLDRRDRSARLLALVAAAVMLQLIVEVSRAFVAYSYPWHLVRVAAIAMLAATTAVSGAAYAARRFAPEWRRRAPALTAAAALAGLALIPWYDLKALAAILAGVAALAACGWRGRSRAALTAAGLVLVLMLWQLTAFLDRFYYLVMAGLLVLLVAEQVWARRLARRNRDSEAERAAALEVRLRRAEAAGETIVTLKDGTRSHRVAESDILSIRAADDYCDVTLVDGRTLLVTANLSALLAGLPGGFVRIHKSHAVNRAHVEAVAPRPGGGRVLMLAGGGAVPVGRSYGDALALLRPK